LNLAKIAIATHVVLHTPAMTAQGTFPQLPPLLQIAGHGGTMKQETDQTVLTIAKALTKTTNCTCRAEKVEGNSKKFSPAFRAGRVPPLSN